MEEIMNKEIISDPKEKAREKEKVKVKAKVRVRENQNVMSVEAKIILGMTAPKH
jgi:hypothetical protein